MRYLDEYRDPAAVQKYVDLIARTTTREWTIMEICGGQTHSIVRYGLETLLPKEITLVHGPGCPVCVTPLAMIDRAIILASRPEILFASFGDMLRVPGSERDLLSVKAAGGDVRMVYSPLDAVRMAAVNPEKEVVFFAIGFETTAPANAMAVREAHRQGLKNFSILCSHVLVPPAIEAILSASDNRIQAFLAAGHVCTVMGYREYIPLSARFRTPIVVTGFEPVDILHGLSMTIRQLEEGRYVTENGYTRAVTEEGNVPAQRLLQEVFEPSDREWRGIGMIPMSGYRLREKYRKFDAEYRYDLAYVTAQESPLCIAGEILKGLRKPLQCPAFGTACTPEHPLGAPMVSAEGACAAYFHYRRVTTP
jgi:hydrogenase expression/formation protein HypD